VVRSAPVAAVLGGTADRAYDVVLVDPPYQVPDVEIAGWLVGAAAHGWLAGSATVVVERRASRSAFPWPPPLAGGRARRYGDTALHVARCYGADP
jgi:16S rRNA (guanine966-N2)-methyltransferase